MASDGERNEEHVDVHLIQLLAVDLAMNDPAEHGIVGVLFFLFGQLGSDAEQFHRRRELILELVVFKISGLIAKREHCFAQFIRNAEQFAECVNRQS